MTEAVYATLFNLRKIPQRNNNFLALHGEQLALAESLVAQGLVVEDDEQTFGDRWFRLNKRGREAVFTEFCRRQFNGESCEPVTSTQPQGEPTP